MFWSKKKKKAKGKLPAIPDREAVKAQALAHARQARAQIGEENLQRLAKVLETQMKSEGVKARDRIRAMDKGKVADGIRDLMKEDE